MTQISKRALVFLAIVLCTLANSPSALADWSEDFNGSTLQNPWFFGSAAANGSPSPTFEPNNQASNYPDAIVGNQLQMSDSNSLATVGAANQFGVVLQNFTNLRYTGIVNPNGNTGSSDTVALIARGNIAGGQFYGAELSFEDGRFIIFRNDDLAGNGMDLDAVTVPGLDNQDSVWVDFRLIGPVISARLFDAPGGNLLGSVSANDGNYSAGVSGVLAFFAGDVNKPLLAEYDDLNSVSFIPEPTSMALVMLGLAGGASLRRRR